MQVVEVGKAQDGVTKTISQLRIEAAAGHSSPLAAGRCERRQAR